ncbi:MAG: MBOAT family protein [Lachnospiraceae bacterium]|nr:MBOAT family protein [Lachnospiraceae bacterium]
MTFNSLWYFVFLFICFVLLRKCKNKYKVPILLAMNILFYSFNSLLSLILIISVTLVSFLFGYLIEKKRSKKMLMLFLLILFIPLFSFKYIPFVLSIVGIPYVEQVSFFPIGLSFYTFQVVGYIIDVYRGKIKAEKNILIYAIFASMFAYYGGPIGRGEDLLSQLNKVDSIGNASVSRVQIGIRQLLFGCFLKVFVAESIAVIVNPIYLNLNNYSSIMIVFATVLFGIQLYADFCGYSLMALGSANCLNLSIIRNFKEPYLSVSVTDFWRRWHISLSSWFRDYVYISLGGNRCSKGRQYFNLLVTFLLSGLWHGANWTFIIWGGLNGIYLCVEKVLHKNSIKKTGWHAVVGRIYTFILISFSWAFFKASSLSDAVIAGKAFGSCWNEIFSIAKFEHKLTYYFPINGSSLYNLLLVFLGIMSVTLIDTYQYKKSNSLEFEMEKWSWYARLIVYISIMLLLLVFGAWTTSGNFIYVNF